MNKFIRIFNQNIVRILITVLIIIFGYVMIQLLNDAYKESRIQAQSDNKTLEERAEEAKYQEESKSLVSGDTVSNILKNNFGDLIETFLKEAFDGNYDKAYNLLSSNCKNVLYPTEEIFVDQYCKSKFKEGKTYEFQSWSTGGAYIYEIRIFDDMLATGRVTNKSYIQDFYSIVKDEEEYKLNINGYVGMLERNKRAEKDNIKISVNYSKIYMDYEIYNLTITNNSDKDIMLDSKQDSEAVYITDDNNFEYYAFMFEKLDEDLVIKSGEQKEIEIKFSNNYNENIQIQNMVFSEVVKDYNSYVNDEDNYSDYMEIKIQF